MHPMVLMDAVSRGDTKPTSVGKCVILPPSFTGGTRYMFNNYQDAMAICKQYEYHDLFITITCNANWREIILSDGNLKASDKPDIVCRVFKIKLDQLMKYLSKGKIFGKTEVGKLIKNL